MDTILTTRTKAITILIILTTVITRVIPTIRQSREAQTVSRNTQDTVQISLTPTVRITNTRAPVSAIACWMGITARVWAVMFTPPVLMGSCTTTGPALPAFNGALPPGPASIRPKIAWIPTTELSPVRGPQHLRQNVPSIPIIHIPAVHITRTNPVSQ